jgi:hypothetical protein
VVVVVVDIVAVGVGGTGCEPTLSCHEHSRPVTCDFVKFRANIFFE